MKYKISKFNMLINYSDLEYLLFNTNSTSLLKMYKVDYNDIKSNVRKDEFTIENCEIILKLLELGIIIPYDIDEIEIIKTQNSIWRHNPKVYSVSIVPNIDCNFRCKYCFEEIEEKYMSEETILNIEKFFNKRIGSEKIEFLDIGWYGGEPLLSKNIISRLSETFAKVKNFRACIFTNGYDFDDDFIRNLPKYGIDLVHITIDGIKGIHDKYRIHKNGNETFEKIINNIKKIIEYHNDTIYINIRTNLDNDNKNYYGELLKIFQEIKSKKFKFHFSKIHEISTGLGKNYCGGLSDEETEEVFNNIRGELIKNKFKRAEDILPKNQNCHHCYVSLDNGFTINHDGLIYKCFGDANPPKNSIGSLNSIGEIDFISSEYLRWYNHDCLENKMCINCILLPVCMGGCKHNSLGLSLNLPSKCNHLFVIKRVKKNIIDVYKLKNKLL